jgi:hypothetical protein
MSCIFTTKTKKCGVLRFPHRNKSNILSSWRHTLVEISHNLLYYERTKAYLSPQKTVTVPTGKSKSTVLWDVTRPCIVTVY